MNHVDAFLSILPSTYVCANFFLVHELYPSVPLSGSALIYIPDIPTPPNGTDSVRICLQPEIKKKGEACRRAYCEGCRNHAEGMSQAMEVA